MSDKLLTPMQLKNEADWRAAKRTRRQETCKRYYKTENPKDKNMWNEYATNQAPICVLHVSDLLRHSKVR